MPPQICLMKSLMDKKNQGTSHQIKLDLRKHTCVTTQACELPTKKPELSTQSQAGWTATHTAAGHRHKTILLLLLFQVGSGVKEKTRTYPGLECQRVQLWRANSCTNILHHTHKWDILDGNALKSKAPNQNILCWPHLPPIIILSSHSPLTSSHHSDPA